MTSLPSPICIGCTRLHAGAALTCDAYPDGIPRAILDSDADHRQPYPGDAGKLFMPVSPAALDYARRMFTDE